MGVVGTPGVRHYGVYRNEVEDLGGKMGLVYKVIAQGQAYRVTHKHAGMIFPVEATIAEVKLNQSESFIVDASHVLSFSENCEIEVVAKSQMCLFAVLYFSPKGLRESAALYEIQAEEFASTVQRTALFYRTTWFGEIAHRYLFERLTLCRKENIITNFLELEIAKEIYYFQLTHQTSPDQRKRFVVLNDDVKAVIAYIEKELFQKIEIADLLKVWRTSESTLLRAFQKELNMSPFEFINTRRLDEAELLLRTKRYTVKQVALMVGYSAPAAFSTAFKRKFGFSPNEILGK